jgi:hypothetical protein
MESSTNIDSSTEYCASAPSKVDRRWQYAIRVLTGGMIALFLIFGGIIVYWVARPTPFDPLIFQTAQVRTITEDGAIIVPQVPGEDAPSIYLDQDLPIIIYFCSNADEEFVAKRSSWFVDAVRGDRYLLREGLESVIRSGCVAPRLDVEIPPQVHADLLNQMNGYGETSSWYIEGEVTPDRDGGVTSHWRSEIFYIIAESEPK